MQRTAVYSALDHLDAFRHDVHHRLCRTRAGAAPPTIEAGR